MHFKMIVPAVALAVALSGCTTNPYTGEQQTSKAVWGSLAGAATGAAVGAMSSSKGDRK
ncbi:MAG: OmpA family lipoprotein, partial [Aeromonas sobria]